MARKRTKRSAAAEKAKGVADAARELAESDSLKEFVGSTGSAVREFTSSVSDAAKDLLESTEKATQKVRKQRKPRRLRKLLRFGLVAGAAAAILGNQRTRNAIGAQIKKLGGGEEPPPWADQAARTDGEIRAEPAPSPAAPN